MTTIAPAASTYCPSIGKPTMTRSARSARVTSGPDRFPAPPIPMALPNRGRAAVVVYLRAHLYGAAVGRTILDRCISTVDRADRVRLVPLRAQFDHEIATAQRLLGGLTPFGAPGRRVLRVSSTVTLAALPAGPFVREPLTRLGLLETLRTLVVAKRAMWELLAESWVADAHDINDRNSTDTDDNNDNDNDKAGSGSTRRLLLGLADQARAQEDLLEELRRAYGLAVFG